MRVITIDGPSSSGKTTTAKALAKRLNCVVLESGGFYRLVTWLLLEGNRLEEFLFNSGVERHEVLKELFKGVKVELTKEGTKFFVNDRLVKEELRKKRVDERVSEVSAIKEVREFVTQVMRELANSYECVVAEGRDMGSVVFPDAELKVFLTASTDVRAKRRLTQLKKVWGESRRVDEVVENIKKRDAMDSSRKVAPLRVPDGARVIDTSQLELEEVVNEICRLLESRT